MLTPFTGMTVHQEKLMPNVRFLSEADVADISLFILRGAGQKDINSLNSLALFYPNCLPERIAVIKHNTRQLKLFPGVVYVDGNILHPPLRAVPVCKGVGGGSRQFPPLRIPQFYPFALQARDLPYSAPHRDCAK